MAKQNGGKIAIVTGGSNGIGNAIALRLANENITVIVADVVPPDQQSSYISYRYCNVTKGEEVDLLYRWVVKEYGIPDVLVLSAGKGIHEQLTQGDPDKWFGVIDLNIMGVLRCIRAFVPAMQQKQSGHVVFISSVAAEKPYTYGGVYAASKAAIEVIAETLRLETLPAVSITVVAPGTTKTGFFKDRADAEALVAKSLLANDIAEDVWYAINKRTGAAINKIITRPPGQEF